MLAVDAVLAVAAVAVLRRADDDEGDGDDERVDRDDDGFVLDCDCTKSF